MMSPLKLTLIVFMVMALSYCASPVLKPLAQSPPKPAVSSKSLTDRHILKVSELKTFSAQGRISLTKENEGGSARFIWDQKGDHFTLKLIGTLGAGSAKIFGNSKEVRYQDSQGKDIRGHSPEEVMEKALGWQVPLSSFPFWFKGIPSPEGPITEQISLPRGQLKSLSQRKWAIEFNQYHQQYTPTLPKKIKFTNGPLKVKVYIRAWGLK